MSEQLDSQPEQQPIVRPQIYVASLSDYNAGNLHGMWIDAAIEDEELWKGVHAMLQSSPSPNAEEWAIHDYEGFGPLRLGEYENLETVAMIARGIAEHGIAFAHWSSIVGTNDAVSLARFDEAYLGNYNSLESYAEQLLDDLGLTQQLDDAVPELLRNHVSVDVEGFGRDMELDGMIEISHGDGEVFVFEGRT